ncbi:MAG: tetratricopeptide repeat protein [Phycisphaera sp. TMED9]|nr:MAG: tetratricopeptide repeat protein [Phycisphaera sp. TMED9]
MRRVRRRNGSDQVESWSLEALMNLQMPALLPSSRDLRAVVPKVATLILIASAQLLIGGCDGSVSTNSNQDQPVVGLPLPSDLDDYDVGVKAAIEAELVLLQEAAEDPVAWERLGDLYLAHDRPGLAIECYTGSLELDADRVRPVYLRAWAHHDLGDLKNARSDIERALELDPATTHLKWRAAGWMAEEGDLDAAVSMAQSSIIPPEVDLNAVRMLAKIRLEEGRADETVRLLEPVLKIQPGDRGSHYVVGRAKQMLGRGDEAARHLRIAGDARSTFGDPWLNEAMSRRSDLAARLLAVEALSRAKRHDDAALAVDQLRTQYGELREIDYADVVVLVNREDFRAALDLSRRLAESDPGWALPRFREAQCLLVLAGASDPAGVDLVEQAVDAAKAGIASAPAAVEGHELLGRSLGGLGRWNEAAASFSKCIELAPLVARHQVQLGDALVESGDPMAAIRQVDRMDAEFGRSVDAGLVRVRALAAFGRMDEAKALLAQCRRAMPDHPDLPRTARALGGLP